MRLLIVCLMLCQHAGAEIYKYTDENGKVHFTDSPPLEVTPEILEIGEPVNQGIPAPDKKAAEALFEQDKIRQEELRRESVKKKKRRNNLLAKKRKVIWCE